MRIWLTALSLLACLAPAGADEMTFARAGQNSDCPACGWIAAEGAITLDTADRLLAFLRQERFSDPAPRVDLHSDGGSILGALKLGRVIRAKGLATRVARTSRGPHPGFNLPGGSLPGARCLSACGFAFLGGVERRVDPDAVLAVSGFAREVAFLKPAERLFKVLEVPLERVIKGLLLEYVVGMGIDPRLVEIAASVGPGEIRLLKPHERTGLGVVATAPPSKRDEDPDSMEPWKIGAYREGVVAFSRSRDGLTQVTLYCNTSSRRRRYALVKSDKREMSARVHEFLRRTEGRSIFGRELSRSAVTLNPDDNGGAARITLPRSLDLTRIEEPGLLGLGAAYSPDPLSLTLPSDGLADAARLAFRNCIS